jgi:TetR/AcrR family transcriptional regulator
MTLSPSAPDRLRDAERSREAILAAAEELFADRGFDGASLQDIGAAAGLSRGTPSYFFGSKEQLYVAVLERVFAARQDATAQAFEPVHAWAHGDAGTPALARAFTRATDGYLDFLLGRPAFAQLIVREELARAERLRSARRASTAMHDAFAAVRAVARRRGLRPFDVDDAVLLYVALTFMPVAHRATVMASLGRDLGDPAVRRRHVRFVVAQVMQLVGG